MEPTLEIGQRVLVDRFTSRLGADPDVGDVIVFNPPVSAVPEEQEGQPSCCPSASKATSGCPMPPAPSPAPNAPTRPSSSASSPLPGDKLEIVNGEAIVNGKVVEGDWATIPCHHNPRLRLPPRHHHPRGHLLRPGRQPPGSKDSRFWGPVPRDWIIGHAVATYWPIDRIGGL